MEPSLPAILCPIPSVTTKVSTPFSGSLIIMTIAHFPVLPPKPSSEDGALQLQGPIPPYLILFSHWALSGEQPSDHGVP